MLYLSVAETAVSAILTRVEGPKHTPIYYISKGLLPAEERYSPMEKLVLPLVTTARKLRPYFQSHPIVVITENPIKVVLHRPELSGRMVKWAVELSEHDITFRSTIKAQALAEFIANFTPAIGNHMATEVSSVSNQSQTLWKLLVDRAASKKGSGLGIVLITPEGDTLERVVKCE